eukprot:TRINITY_DN14161_c0_g3_i2.p2 TRINITY_DN14161_c0_g3~~TRINITY_DN14161_c0_g3_i2.p2  ORF type:complete len:107 (+),score=14.27 TRINITY_DN14161_c0_g3_i2:200-520(+)
MLSDPHDHILNQDDSFFAGSSAWGALTAAKAAATLAGCSFFVACCTFTLGACFAALANRRILARPSKVATSFRGIKAESFSAILLLRGSSQDEAAGEAVADVAAAA